MGGFFAKALDAIKGKKDMRILMVLDVIYYALSHIVIYHYNDNK